MHFWELEECTGDGRLKFEEGKGRRKESSIRAATTMRAAIVIFGARQKRQWL
jgi:hypothetical protein